MPSPTPPIVLAIDTTSPVQGLALAAGSVLMDFQTLAIPTSHSETLLPHTDQLLARNHLSGADLDGLAAVTGPGSFTGIRIGLATAEGLADSWDKPLYGWNSLELAALHPAAGDTRIGAAREASRGGIYFAVYQRSPGGLLDPLLAPVELHAPETPAALAPFSGLVIAGPAAARLAGWLPAGFPARVLETSDPPAVGVLALVAAAAIRAGTMPPTRIEAFYVRPPDAKKSPRWRGHGHGG